MREARALNARQGAQFVDQALDQLGFPSRRIGLWHDEVEGEDARRIPARVHARQPAEAVDQQRGADEQHRRHRQLTDDQYVPQAHDAARRTALSAGASMTERMQAIGARQLERRDHADQQGGSERQGEREAKHAAVDDDLVQPRQHRTAERDLKSTLRVR